MQANTKTGRKLAVVSASYEPFNILLSPPELYQAFAPVRIDNYDGALNIFQSPLPLDKYQDDFKASPNKRYREF